MNEVSQSDFFVAVGKTNCHPTVLGSYPYTSSFRTPYGAEVGRIVNEIPDGAALPVSRYFLVV